MRSCFLQQHLIKSICCAILSLSTAFSCLADDKQRFKEVDLLLTSTFAADDEKDGIALLIFDRQDRLVYSRSLGNFSPERRVPVASASKMIAAAMMLIVIDRGQISLDATTGQLLGWSGKKGQITLRQLLAQISGLNPNAVCMNEIAITLARCVEEIRDDPGSLTHDPGSHFDYGGSHFQVAARMAEVATGKTWNTLFSDFLGKPLSLHAETSFYTAPWLGIERVGTLNPRVGGGMTTSMADYAKILAMIFHRGQFLGQSFASAALFDAMASEPNPAASVGFSPMARQAKLAFRYGLGAWLECEATKGVCPVLSSAGAFGWVPWLDREAGYYAIIGMYRPPGGRGTTGVVAFSVGLEQRLKPLIVKALQP